jgi:hypothetical protein
MLEIGTSGLMSGEGKRSGRLIHGRHRASPRLYVRSYSAEHQRVRTSPVQVPPQEDVGMPE